MEVAAQHETQGPAQILPLQPHPIYVETVWTPVGKRWATTIIRVWDPEDRGKCRLCPKCSLNAMGFCVVSTDRFVPGESCALFSMHGLRLIEREHGLAL